MHRVVVVGADADRDLAARDHGGNCRARDRRHRPPVAPRIRGADSALGCFWSPTIRSPLHLASAMNTPTVAVFGPTVPEFGFGPLATTSAVAGLYGARLPAVRSARPAQVPPRTLALYARDYTDDGCIAGARAPARRPRSLSSDLVTHAHEEATPVHHRRRSRRHQHRRRRDVRGRQAPLRDAVDPDARRVAAPRAWPIASSGTDRRA